MTAQPTHESATGQLRHLMRQAWNAAHISHQSLHECAGRAFELATNDAALQLKMSRSLMPAPAGADPQFKVLALVGGLKGFDAPPPWNIPHTDQRHLERIHLSADRTFVAAYEIDRRMWSMWDGTSGRGLFWIADLADIPCWDEASPLRAILNWSLAATDSVMLHGGAVGEGRAVLLVGPGGSGKSTTVAAALARGMHVYGDDLTIVSGSGPTARVWATYDAIKLAPFGAISDWLTSEGAEALPCHGKLIYRISGLPKGRLARSASLAAIMRPVVANQAATAIIPESSATMLKALVPPTVFLLRGMEEIAIRKISTLIRSLPSYRLELGQDPLEAAGALNAWIKETAA